MKHILSFLLITIFCMSAGESAYHFSNKNNPEYLEAREEWVNRTFDSLTKEERLGQLFMIRAHSNLGKDHIAQVENAIRNHHVGGLCFFQGNPEKQAALTNRYQSLSKKIPLMISMDAEWGLGMRFKEDAISFPRQIMLGAIQDNRLLYEMGKEIARQCRRLGVHINFAPVADVNNNPQNPVINFRSFGEDRYNVAAKSYMYMKGMQDANIMACAKHFPGHGDTDVDSHYDLPVISHANNRLDSIELFPFRVLAEHGIESMMVAHLHVPAIDSTHNLPTTLSQKAVGTLLKKDLGYKGLIYTDGLGMKGVTKYYKNGEVEAKALVAGNDVLLLPESVPDAIFQIKEYLKAGKLSPQLIDDRVRKILRSKYDLGLSTFKPIIEQNIRKELNSPQAIVLKRKLIENALTLVRSKNQLVPIKKINGQKTAALSIGSKTLTLFQKTLANYDKIQFINTGKEISSSKSKRLLNKLKDMDLVVVSLHNMSNAASKEFGISKSTRQFLNILRQQKEVILVVFGNPYSLKYFDEQQHVLMAYDEDPHIQELSAQALYGAFSIRGRLPVTASPKSKFNKGVTTAPLFRLGYDIPEGVGLDAEILSQIDDIANDAIFNRATPGCNILVAKDGKVVFNKAYGYTTYSKKRALTTNDIFDLASVTKIAATTLSIMKLHEDGLINIYRPLSVYLPELKKTNKAAMTIEEIMVHRAGLIPWIPFFEQTLTSSRRNPRPSPKFYKKKRSVGFNVPVTGQLFMRNDFVDEMKKQIWESDLRPNKNYKYSDLGFYLLSDLVRRITGKPLDEFATEHFYQPLGLQTMTYKPWQKFALTTIVPSEDDKYFRRQQVKGYVHDMGAAMLGGVSGHAGLFSNITDVAIVLQMLLNGGYYGGKQFLRPETVQLFTTKYSKCTRRGIGFDMKEMNLTRSQNMSNLASPHTFGHLGFTGICAWADPDKNLIYIFLSNRTFPSMKNYKLNREDYRPRIQRVVYEALLPKS